MNTLIFRMFLVGCVIVSSAFLPGCSFLEELLDVIPGAVPGKEEDKPAVTPTQKPDVFCAYFHYFKAGPEQFDQWWMQGRNPKDILGPEQWRRNIWVGRKGDYPYIGIYNNVSDGEMMRWHIRLAKAAGMTAFLVYINDWQSERQQTNLLLNIAKQENFKIGFVEHHSFLGVRSLPTLEGRTPPFISEKYAGYDEIMERHTRDLGLPLPSSSRRPAYPSQTRSLRNVPPDALNRARDRISGMVNEWKNHPAYLRIDDKPIIVIPYIAAELTAGEFNHLVYMIQNNVGQELYVVAIVADVYWYFFPEAVEGTGLTKEWGATMVNSFTHWTPNGMITASQQLRLKATRFHVKDSAKWKKDAMIPLMPGFDDDAWRPGNVPAPSAPRNNGQAWSDQLDAALAAKPRFLFIQAWNEWHEGSQIEPSTLYSEPYLYLRILSQKLNQPWQTPPLPPKSNVDYHRKAYLPY